MRQFLVVLQALLLVVPDDRDNFKYGNVTRCRFS